MALTIARNPVVRHTALGDVAIVLWTGEPTIAANRWLVDGLLSSVVAKQPSCIVLVFIGEHVSVPSAETRKDVQKVFRNELAPVRRLVNVPLGDSVKQTLFRSVLRAMAMLGDSRRVVSVAGNIEEAIAAARSVAGPQTPHPLALRGAIEALFSDMDDKTLSPNAQPFVFAGVFALR